MTEPDYLLFITAHLLTLDETSFLRTMDDFSTRYEVIEMIKPGSVSLGGRYGTETGFLRWIGLLRQEKVKSVQAFEIHSEKHGLAPATAHAFAGSHHTFISITSAQQRKTFGLQTFSSPRYAITPEQFVSLVNQQEKSPLLWDRIAFLIQESNALNSRPSFETATIQEYLVKERNTYDFEFMVGTLADEIQLELAVNNTSFKIPDAFAGLFFKSSPIEFGGIERKIVFLYPLNEVTADNLVSLINAQSFSESEVWNKLTELIKGYGSTELPDLSPDEWPVWLSKQSSEHVNAVANTISRAVAEVCEAKGIDRIIPEELSALFGPDDTENKRAHARGERSEKVYLAEYAEPWRMYFFEEAEGVAAPPLPDAGKAKSDFLNALNAIAAFARKNDSPFHAAFSLAALFLGEGLPTGSFDAAHWEAIKDALRLKGYDERATANAERSFTNSSADLTLMGRTTKVFPMIALDLSDVFGGMGSWNDQYFDAPAVQEEYQRLTGEAFLHHRSFFTVFLSELR